jgi:hypothetical protein
MIFKLMKIKILLLAVFVSFMPFFGFSQTDKPVAFKGIIIDAQTNEPIPSASVVLIGKGGQVTRTNLAGKFTLLASANTAIKKQIKVSCVGYKTELLLLVNEQKEQEIKLSPESHNLGELTVKKQKYHNKNNPAVELIENVIANKGKNRKESLDYYENEAYEKIQFAFNEISPKFKQKKIFKHFQFMFEPADSTDSPGEIMPIYMKEVLSNHFYRKSPKDDKQIIKSQKMVNFQGLDNKGLDDNIKYMYQDINIYDNNILMLTNQFLSPIAPSAPSFYRYYITDTIQSGSEKFIKLFFGSRNKQDMLFQGFLYITMDGTYAIQGVELSVNKNINLNLVRDVKISQRFEKIPNQGWLLKSDQTAINFAISNKGQSLLGKRTVSYKNYKFTPPSNDSIFKGLSVVTLDSANMRSEEYWEANRHQELSKSEEGTYAIVDSLQKVPAFRRTMDIAQIVFFGYKVMGKYEIGPVNTFYSYNPIEGIRARFGGRTTPEFSKKINFETYLGYGFGDHNLKYFLSSTWSLAPTSIYEFPVKSIKASYQKDTKFPGQDLQFITEDNVLLSIKRGVNDKLFYNRTFKLEHLNEFENHFSYTLGYQFTKTVPGGNLYFNNTDYSAHTNDVGLINISETSLKLRYAPNEKFYQSKSFRIPVYTKYPIFELQITNGSRFLKNDYNYTNVRFSFSKRFYFSVLGFSDVVWESGKIFGKVPYPLLNIHRANQTYSYQILSYNLMNFLEFVSDQYTSLNIDHCFNGFFLNKIPIVRRLQLREYATFKLLEGSVSKTNDPTKNTDLFQFPMYADGKTATYGLGKTPYIEGSVGIGNIFKIFRIDLVKRFTYLNNPNISTLGLRMRFRFDF